MKTKRKSRAERSQVSVQAYPEVFALFGPIVTFLRRSGIPDSQLSKEFARALHGATHKQELIDITRIGTTTWCAYIVDRWLRDPAYLNAIGKPRDIPLTGRTSIAALIRIVGANANPTEVVKFLSKFGTVQKTNKGTYGLVKRYMNYTIPGTLPYEPNLEFLVDAVAASTRGLGRRKPEDKLFWLRAQNENIPQKYIDDFLAYVRQRSLVFLQEVDDWLEEHAASESVTKKKKKDYKRVGLGLFPICSDLQM